LNTAIAGAVPNWIPGLTVAMGVAQLSPSGEDVVKKK
jgi:hypothetical protein